MAILTRQQVERLAEIIEQHTTWFIWSTFGSKYVSKADVDRLKNAGILPMDVQVSTFKNAYILGKLEALLKRAEFKSLSWADLQKEAVGRLTPYDHLQIEAAEFTAYTMFRGLADDIRAGLYRRLAMATNRAVSEAQVRGTIKDVVKTGVELSQSYQKVAAELVEALKEPNRNWTRVAATEIHSAWQRGVAMAIMNKEEIYADSDGIDSEVFVDHGIDACEDCQRIYTTDGSTPKIFKLRELLGNEGSNYQRPWRQNAKPVLPPLHPHCFGSLQYVPPGWGFDKEGRFTLVDPEKAYPEIH